MGEDLLLLTSSLSLCHHCLLSSPTLPTLLEKEVVETGQVGQEAGTVMGGGGGLFLLSPPFPILS